MGGQTVKQKKPLLQSNPITSPGSGVFFRLLAVKLKAFFSSLRPRSVRELLVTLSGYTRVVILAKNNALSSHGTLSEFL